MYRIFGIGYVVALLAILSVAFWNRNLQGKDRGFTTGWIVFGLVFLGAVGAVAFLCETDSIRTDRNKRMGRM